MWEYLVIEVGLCDLAGVEKRLSNLGSEGWELVGVGSCNLSNTLYLKRARKY